MTKLPTPGRQRQLPPRVFWGIVGAVLIAAGVILNPSITRAWTVIYGVLAIEVLGFGLVCSLLIFRSMQRDLGVPRPFSSTPVSGRAWITMALLAVVWSLHYPDRWRGLPLLPDDPHYLARSTDWPTTWRCLLDPHNEHKVVPQRLMVYVTIRLSDVITLPHAMQVVGTVMFVVDAVLLFLLLRRRFQSEWIGLLVVTLFGMSTSYREILEWFTGSLWLITLGMLLVGCWALGDDERPTRRGFVIACLIALAAPYSFSIGAIVGPIFSLWILANRQHGSWPRQLTLALPTTICAVLGVASLTPAMLAWFKTDEYLANSSQATLTLFDPWMGLALTNRKVVDALCFRNLGWPVDATPWWVAAVVFPLLAGLILRTTNAVSARWRLLPALGLLTFPYAATMPFRGRINYMVLSTWTRYDLFPQLGLALLIGGFVAHRQSSAVTITRRQQLQLLALAAVLLLLHRLGR